MTYPEGGTDFGEIFDKNIRGVAYSEGDWSCKGGGRTTGGSHSLLRCERDDRYGKARM